MTMPTSVKVLQDAITVTVPLPAPGPSVVKVSVPGQQGPSGAPGPQGQPGQPRWSGIGPPGVIVGAEPNDEYIDNATGDIYKLT